MNEIIKSLDPQDRLKYDYDLLEEKYIENQNRVVDDQTDLESLEAALKYLDRVGYGRLIHHDALEASL